tara:strand:+ start:256 stop:546 length:291 start_codon:yes stop_codon:yes gene_type:complete
MRQITRDAIRAFRNGNNFKRGNTQVRTYAHSNYREFLLHGNVIADMNENGLFISDGGWQTVTTKERLNGFPNVHIYQKNFQWFLNGKEWDGSRIKV